MIMYPDLIDQIEEIAFDLYLSGIIKGGKPPNINEPDLGDMRDIISKKVHKMLNLHITRKYETKRKL